MDGEETGGGFDEEEEVVVVDEKDEDAEQVRDEKRNIYYLAGICMKTNIDIWRTRRMRR